MELFHPTYNWFFGAHFVETVGGPRFPQLRPIHLFRAIRTARCELGKSNKGERPEQLNGFPLREQKTLDRQQTTDACLNCRVPKGGVSKGKGLTGEP